MNNVRTAEFENEERPVPELGDDGPDVLDAKQPIDRSRGHGVDGDDPRVDRALSAPPVQQPTRLTGMPANNARRRNHDGNAERWQGILHMAEVSGAYWLQATRRQRFKQAGISDVVVTIRRLVTITRPASGYGCAVTDLR